MNSNDWHQYERFILGDQRTSWSDIERARYLRKQIRASLARLDRLYMEPEKNKQWIFHEEIAMRNATLELQELEAKMLWA